MIKTVIRNARIQGLIVCYVVPSAVSTTAIALLSARNIAAAAFVVFSEGEAHLGFSDEGNSQKPCNRVERSRAMEIVVVAFSDLLV